MVNASSANALGTVAVLPDARDSGIYQTSPGLLRRRALGPWAEGIAQYMAIRVGDAARGRAAFQSLSRLLTSLPPEELLVAPGPRAQLYRLARSIAETERAMPGPIAEDLPWRDHSGRHGKALAKLREALDPDDAELLELRHARELSVEEIACVLERPVDAVELALDTAEALARKALGKAAPDPVAANATVYVEAFALARSWQELEGGLPPIEVDEEALEPGTLIGGRYAVVDRVGTGAFGDVYRAEDVEVPGHQIALKLLRQPSLSEAARQSALRELKLNAAVFHPSLVQFKDHGWYEQRLWFVMPWYEGETLEARMKRGALSRREARRIFEPLARALAALHETGIRHQDIKPENILLTRLPGTDPESDDGILPVLIDLGVAATEQETMLGGTPLYFAPEVAKRFVRERHGGPDVTSAADVFALALSLRNALEPGTQEDVAAGAIQAFVERRAEEMPPLPEARDLRYLAPSLRTWLSLDALERPSALELAEELAILTAPEERRARRGRLLRWLVPLMTTLAAIFVLVVWALDRRAAQEEVAARQARSAAAEARADYIVADARRQALEEGHASLLAQYERSRMSREELAESLATQGGQLRIVRGELARTLEQLEGAQQQATRLGGTLADAQRESERLRGELDASRSEAGQRLRELDAARAEVERLAAALQGAEARARRESDRADAAETELTEARRARDATQRELERAEAAEAEAERELSALQGRIRSLLSATAAAAGPASTEPEPSPEE